MNAQEHDPNCSCKDLSSASLDKLVALNNDLPTDADSLSPEDITQKTTLCLKYLRAEDIPVRGNSSCTHVLGQLHAHFALCILAHISYLTRPDPDSDFATRLVAAWGGIHKWLLYTFQHWIVSPMFSKNAAANRRHAYQTIVLSLRSFVKIPPICDLILADDGGKAVFVMLGSCWLYEAEDEFKSTSDGNPTVSAAEPLLDLGTFKPGPPPDVFFGCLLSGADAGKPARVALEHLAYYLTNTTTTTPTPSPASASWAPQAIFLLHYHLRMMIQMSHAPPYLHALLAAHAVRSTTLILVSLTTHPWDESTAPGIAQCIAASLDYLSLALPNAGGYAQITYAVRMGVVPAIVRSGAWVADEDGSAREEVLGLLAVYTMYPPLLRALVPSLRRSHLPESKEEEEDTGGWKGAYRELRSLAEERAALLDVDLDSGACCLNCGIKVDAGNDNLSCDKCFAAAYCSEACREAHWEGGHKESCRSPDTPPTNSAPPTPTPNPITPSDLASARKIILAEIQQRRKSLILTACQNEDTPVVVSLNYLLPSDPRGIMVVGHPRTRAEPPEGYAEFREVREAWDEAIAQASSRSQGEGEGEGGEEKEKEKEKDKCKIVVGAYLPYGSGGGLHFFEFEMGVDAGVKEGD